MLRPRAFAVGLLVVALATAGCLAGSTDETAEEGAELTNASASAASAPLEAQLDANRTEGTAPMDVAFHLDAESNATWNLTTGDGGWAEGSQLPAVVEHTYESSGNHTANLTVVAEDAKGSATLTIHVEPASSGDDRGGNETNEANETDEDGSEDDSDDEERVDESPNCTRFVPSLAEPTGRDGWETRTLEVAFAVDAAFARQEPNWRAVVQDHARAMSALYEGAIAVEIQPVHVIAIPEENVTINGTTGEAIEDLRAYYEEEYPDLQRDAVYLFSGGRYTNAAGQAACIGGAGYRNDAYAVGEGIRGGSEIGPFTYTGDRALKIATHEVAHLLAAHHHHANCAESAPNTEVSRPADACTVMINVVNAADLSFSTLNRLVMRSHVDAIHGGEG